MSALADDEMDGTDRAALDVHVAQCPACQRAYAAIQQLRRSFAVLPEPAVEFDLAPDIVRLIDKPVRAGPGAESAQRPARAAAPQWALLAPACAAAVGLGLWLGATVMPVVGSAAGSGPVAAQMDAFSSTPTGSLCLASGPCGRTGR